MDKPDVMPAPGAKIDVRGHLRPPKHQKSGGHQEEQTYTDLETGEKSQRMRWVAPEETRCRGINRGGKNPWRGNRCSNVSIRGGTVCTKHGGAIPNVKKAAERRLAMAAMPAAARLIDMALRKKKMADRDRIRALCEILDRAGLSGKTHVEIELKPWQDMLRKIAGGVEAEDIELEEYDIIDGDAEVGG